MISIRAILSILSVGLLFVTSVSAQAATSEVRSQADDDLAIGMMGLKQAASDPKLLAQLMADLKDPEMMAEAKKNDGESRIYCRNEKNVR